MTYKEGLLEIDSIIHTYKMTVDTLTAKHNQTKDVKYLNEIKALKGEIYLLTKNQ